MTFDFAAARQNMVETQIRTNDVTDPAVQRAMRISPREEFCGQARHLAYADTEVEYAPGRWLMRPRDIGKLLHALKPKAGEKALAIAAPYAADVLRQIGLDVVEAEPDAAPTGAFDVIVTEGSVAEVPQAWLSALAPGGRLGVVERNGAAGHARIYLSTDDGIGARTAFDAAPPWLDGFGRKPVFAL